MSSRYECLQWLLIRDPKLNSTELLAPLCNQANMLVTNKSLWRSLPSQHLISLSLALINKRVETLSSNFLRLVLKWTPSVRAVQLGSKSNAWSICICLRETDKLEVIVPFNVVGFKNRFLVPNPFFLTKIIVSLQALFSFLL